jgi:hypothetical protein
MRRMGEAIPMAIIHSRAFRSFSAGLKSEGNVPLDEWEKAIKEWDEDMSNASPYVMPDEGMSPLFHFMCHYVTLICVDVKISMVKKHLLAEEHRKATLAGADASLMEVTATSLIINGLEIEDMQYVSILGSPDNTYSDAK